MCTAFDAHRGGLQRWEGLAMKCVTAFALTTALATTLISPRQALAAQAPAPTAAQTPTPTAQPPSPTSPQTPRSTGAGAIRGRVVDAITGQPLARARVRLNRRGLKTIFTDQSGSFAFTNVPAGPVTVMAEKPLYAPGSFPTSQRTLRSKRLIIEDGGSIDGVTIPLYRGGVIAGRLVDVHGDPVENAGITLMSVAGPGGAPSKGNLARRALPSNDNGEFRVGRLDAGVYVLIASPSSQGESDDTGLGRLYYPGVASFDQAQPITIEKGQTVSDLEFTLSEVRLTRVAGSVLNALGQPLRDGQISVQARSQNGALWPSGTGGRIREDGSFDLRIQPGDYVLEVAASIKQGQNPASPPIVERGLLPLTVGAEPMAGVVITADRGATATGRIVFEGRGEPPADLRKVLLTFQPLEIGGAACQSLSQPTINRDGSFTAENLWGACQIRTMGIDGWQLKSIVHKETDVTTRPFSFSAGQRVSDVQVVFTDRLSDLSLEVTDDQGEPSKDYVAVVFPTNAELWSDPRFLRTTVVEAERAATGRELKGLLAGEYFAVATEDLAFGDLENPAFLKRLASVSNTVTLTGDGQAVSLRLRRIALPSDIRRSF
jgi:hypothetical protein